MISNSNKLEEHEKSVEIIWDNNDPHMVEVWINGKLTNLTDFKNGSNHFV